MRLELKSHGRLCNGILHRDYLKNIPGILCYPVRACFDRSSKWMASSGSLGCDAPVNVGGHDGIVCIHRIDELLIEGVRVSHGGQAGKEARICGVAVTPVCTDAALSHALEHI